MRKVRSVDVYTFTRTYLLCGEDFFKYLCQRVDVELVITHATEYTTQALAPSVLVFVVVLGEGAAEKGEACDEMHIADDEDRNQKVREKGELGGNALRKTP